MAAPFGRKRLDYRASATAPAFTFDDRALRLPRGHATRAPAPTLFFRGNARAPVNAARRCPAPTSVVDAGFDEFVARSTGPRLQSGKPVPMQFARAFAPSQPWASRCRGSAAQAIAGEDAWLFRLKLDGLLGLVAPSIDVSYGKQSRRLLRFEGLSNLRDASGRHPLVARIDFPRPARPAPESEWQSALALRWSGCEPAGQRGRTCPCRTPRRTLSH